MSFTMLNLAPYASIAIRVWGYSRDFKEQYGRAPTVSETSYYLRTGDQRSYEDIEANELRRQLHQTY